MINHKNFPEPRYIKSSYEVDIEDNWLSLWDKWETPIPEFWEWRFLWNWKAAYKKYQHWKLEQKMFDLMAEEIRKECDEAILQVIKEEAEKLKTDK